MVEAKNEQVERELEQLVSIITDVVPSLTEIRVFGSYNNGNWNPKTSDIDVFVETSDENYSRYRNRREGIFGESLDSIERIEIRERIKKRFGPIGNFRLSLHFLSKEDVKLLSSHYSGNFVFGAKEGRLIYPEQKGVAV